MSTVDPRALADYLARQRWFTGPGHNVVVDQIRSLPWLQEPSGGLGVRVELADVSDGSSVALYNLPLSYRRESIPTLDHGRIGAAELADGEYHVYDALHDPEAIGVLIAGFEHPALSSAGLAYVRIGEVELGQGASTALLSAEQSNTSVIIDDVAMLKFFRRVSPGRNPDVEVLAALSADYSDTVPRLYGWLSSEPTDALGACDLAILQAFLRTATEGWESARTSVRDLLAEPEIPADEAGGDFAGEAERLGAATRHVHDGMARLLPVDSWGQAELSSLVDRFTTRLHDAIRTVPELAVHRDRVLAAYAPVRELRDAVPVQRIHGDLHLGQTLRTSIGWKLIDFEGEPAKPLAERTRLDSPMRDVAGMLRSLDYVAQAVLVQVGPSESAELAAAAWTARNRDAFLRGYGAPQSDADAVLLHAYEVDKTVYEVVYETLHRPAWVHIPLRALA